MGSSSYPKCPRGDWHEVTPFWLFTDEVGRPPRGVMCLYCDDVIVSFDDETEQRVAFKRVLLGRVGVGTIGYVRP